VSTFPLLWTNNRFPTRWDGGWRIGRLK
jgi:hypothetical protein